MLALASRTRQTLGAIEPSLGKRSTVEVVPALYAASETELLGRLQALPHSIGSVMLIGHNPGLHDLARASSPRAAPASRQLEERGPTGALATLVADNDSWAGLGPGGATLVDYVVAEQLCGPEAPGYS